MVKKNSILSFQKREIFQDLAPLLWHSFGTVAALLQVCMIPLFVYVYNLHAWRLNSQIIYSFNPTLKSSVCCWGQILYAVQISTCCLESKLTQISAILLTWCIHTCQHIQEIVSIYSALSPPTLSPGASNRVCNALALLQVHNLMK